MNRLSVLARGWPDMANIPGLLADHIPIRLRMKQSHKFISRLACIISLFLIKVKGFTMLLIPNELLIHCVPVRTVKEPKSPLDF